MSTYTYLIIDLCIILPPLAMSFDRKVEFYKNWIPLFPAILITGLVFIPWDIAFTKDLVWAFNDTYVLGVCFLDLPLEEWLFFLTVPYSCIFILEVLRGYFTLTFSKRWIDISYLTLAGVLLALAFLYSDRLYTLVSFVFCTIVILLLTIRSGYAKRGWFLVAYLVGMVPFFIVNGILTALPVVSYNDAENMGIRIGTIPAEDAIYGMGLLFMNFGLYEFFKSFKTTR